MTWKKNVRDAYPQLNPSLSLMASTASCCSSESGGAAASLSASAQYASSSSLLLLNAHFRRRKPPTSMQLNVLTYRLPRRLVFIHRCEVETWEEMDMAQTSFSQTFQMSTPCRILRVVDSYNQNAYRCSRYGTCVG